RSWSAALVPSRATAGPAKLAGTRQAVSRSAACCQTSGAGSRAASVATGLVTSVPRRSVSYSLLREGVVPAPPHADTQDHGSGSRRRGACGRPRTAPLPLARRRPPAGVVRRARGRDQPAV